MRHYLVNVQGRSLAEYSMTCLLKDLGLIGAKLHKTSRETWEEAGNANLRN